MLSKRPLATQVYQRVIILRNGIVREIQTGKKHQTSTITQLVINLKLLRFILLTGWIVLIWSDFCLARILNNMIIS